MKVQSRRNKLETRIVSAAATIAYQQDMWSLYANYYQVSQQSFFDRFKTNDLYALYTYGKQIVGFTGFRMKMVETEQGRCQALYIGQTVMDSKFRGQSLLPRTCCLLFAKHFLTNPRCPIYVWCDALTYKPYLLFANSLNTYFPTRHQATPPREKAIINQLGKHYYGDNYNEEQGTVRKSANVISDPSVIITMENRLNPDIDFFARANPGHAQGHGLLTIARIDWSNFFFLLKKCLKKKLGLAVHSSR